MALVRRPKLQAEGESIVSGLVLTHLNLTHHVLVLEHLFLLFLDFVEVLAGFVKFDSCLPLLVSFLVLFHSR